MRFVVKGVIADIGELSHLRGWIKFLLDIGTTNSNHKSHTSFYENVHNPRCALILDFLETKI